MFIFFPWWWFILCLCLRFRDLRNNIFESSLYKKYYPLPYYHVKYDTSITFIFSNYYRWLRCASYINDKCLKGKQIRSSVPLTLRIFSMNSSAMMPELETLNWLLTRLMLPETRIMAISSLPPDIPTVHFLTREYFLYLIKARNYLDIFNMDNSVHFIFTKRGIC